MNHHQRTQLIGRIAALAVAAVVALAGARLAGATVWTDLPDYSPGSTVWIQGNNANGADYRSGETVDVSVQGPNGYAANCSATVNGAGYWVCSIALWDSYLAVGSYTYTALGRTSGTTESGQFWDSNLTSRAFNGATACTANELNSFTTGEIVCVSAQGLGNNAGQIEWYRPGGALYRTTVFSGVGGKDDWTVINECGTWTTKLKIGASYEQTDSFVVTGCGGTATPTPTRTPIPPTPTPIPTPTNVPPVVNAGADATIDEGGTFAQDGRQELPFEPHLCRRAK
jgi:hypothetical protein